MPTFLAEFFLPRVHADGAAGLARRVERAADPAGGVRFVRAVSVPAEDFCLCLFDATDLEVVRAAVRAAGLVLSTPPTEVELVEALERLDGFGGDDSDKQGDHR